MSANLQTFCTCPNCGSSLFLVRQLVSERRGNIYTAREIIDRFVGLTLVPLDAMRHRGREAIRIKYRYALVYYLREYTTLTMSEIGAQVGITDHSTISHAIKVVKRDIRYDETYAQWLASVDPFTGAQARYAPTMQKQSQIKAA